MCAKHTAFEPCTLCELESLAPKPPFNVAPGVEHPIYVMDGTGTITGRRITEDGKHPSFCTCLTCKAKQEELQKKKAAEANANDLLRIENMKAQRALLDYFVQVNKMIVEECGDVADMKDLLLANAELYAKYVRGEW
jgi:hypothetical protein